MRLARTSALLCLFAFASATLAEVRIQGIDGEKADNVRAWLGIASLAEDAPQPLVESRHRRATEQIRKALQPYGHYRPVIEATLEFTAKGWQARYRIDPGPQVRVTRMGIALDGAGADDEEIIAAKEQASARMAGQGLLHERYESAKATILAAALRRGYVDAAFTRQQMRVDPERGSVVVDWQIETGPQFYFGEVSLGESRVDEDVLRRYIPFEPGDVFDTDTLLKLRLRLSDLGYFDQVDVAADRQAADAENRIPIRVTTTPLPSQHYRLGVGYGSDTGARFTGDIEIRRLNRRGHRLRNNLRLAEENSAVSGQYAIPTGREPGEAWTLGIQARQERLGSTRTDNYQLGLTRNFIRGVQLWQTYINYEKELFRLSGDSRNTDLILPGISLTLSNTDNHLLPGSGYRLFGDVHGASARLGSSATFLQARGSARTVTTLTPNIRLILRGEIGTSIVDEFSELPPSQRFFAGGDSSVRGYDYRSLAPRNADGEIVGGRYLITGSVELDWIVWNNWGFGIFLDSGGAGNDPEIELSRGAGLGLRWRTPVGMLRIDGARPLDGDDHGLRLHVALGAEL